MATKRGIVIERQVLLFEIERRCSFPECNQRVFVGLTKQEAFDYTGFECALCERGNDALLTKNNVLDWGDEIALPPHRSHLFRVSNNGTSSARNNVTRNN